MEKRNYGDPCSREEDVRMLMELACTIGTKDFPASCPVKLMRIQDGYSIWKEFCVAHENYSDIDEE